MPLNLGTVRPGSTLYIPFDSFAGSTGASITLTGLAVTDIEVYKDGGTTQRASDNGYTLLDTDGIDFDGLTGIHGFSISLADNSTAGFWAAGARYFVVVSSVTIDSQTVSFVAATFDIGYPDAVLNTTIATLASQTEFTLTSGPAEDDALNGCVLCLHDVASAVQLGFAVVADYTGSTKTVTLAAATTFTAAATDNVSVFPRTDVGWIKGVAVSTTTAQLGVNAVQAGGTAWGSGAITAASLASDAITAAKIADNAIDAGALAADCITAAKIADGAIDAATFASGAITAAAIAADAIGASELAADAVAEIQNGLATAAALDTVDNFLDTEMAAVLAAVDTEVAAILALLDDARGEPGQGTPPVNPDLATKVDYLYKAWRNLHTQTASEYALYADDGVTKDHEAACSDDGTTFTRGEMATGA